MSWSSPICLARGARLDAFGVGTALATSKDAPTLSGVYKLVYLESDGEVSYRAKLSLDKMTYPGRKQVFRFRNSDGVLKEDIIACENEHFRGAEPLLRCAMREGTRTNSPADLRAIQQHAVAELEKIPAGYSRLRDPERYPVKFSERLQALLKLVRRAVKHGSDEGILQA